MSMDSVDEKKNDIKATILETSDIDNEDIDSDINKKDVLDIDDVVDNDDSDVDDTVADSEYEEEVPDDDVVLPDDDYKLSQLPIDEDFNSSNYYRTIKIVPDNERITSDIMTMFEFSEVIGIRTLQIEKGSSVFTDIGDLNIPYDIAIKELFDRKSPLKIIRKTGRFEQEEWKCTEMGFPFDVRSGF